MLDNRQHRSIGPPGESGSLQLSIIVNTSCLLGGIWRQGVAIECKGLTGGKGRYSSGLKRWLEIMGQERREESHTEIKLQNAACG